MLAMRPLLTLAALAAVAIAQLESLTLEPEPTSTIDDVQPTETETISEPVETGKACGQVAQLASRSRENYPAIQAELAYACLQSVPIDQTAASDTITALQKTLQFQSTLTYLKDPPKEFANPGVDLVGGLDDINTKIQNQDYDNEYDFENDIAALFVKAHDGHLSFGGMAYGGVFRWRRNSQIALISASSDGTEAPKVWAIQDFNNTQSADFTPSAISQIDGKDVAQFLEEESLLNAYHDPDTRYNAMFYMQPAESYGYFTNPRFYPGPTVNITFENGTSNVYDNSALVQDANAWRYVEDGESFYETFVSPSSVATESIKKRSPNSPPPHLENVREAVLGHAYVPLEYPEPAVEHSSSSVPLAGFFIETSAGKVGVLMAQTFYLEETSDAVEFQSVVEDYINEAKKQNVTKHIIDVRTNGGGKVLLGYDTYLQFFPSQEPQTQSRYRGHTASDILGTQLSSFDRITESNGELYTSPFNYHSFIAEDDTDFTSWEDMYPPTEFNNDNFTALLRYNLSDHLVTSSSRFSVGITITGYGSRSSFTEDPFKAEDIVILSDGICASTCALFVELMVQQSGVKTLAIGGRPSLGPMQAVGGTKGTLVLQNAYLSALTTYLTVNMASSRDEATEWLDTLPTDFSIATSDASVNFQDNIRKGLEEDGIPSQFLNDSASCRIWYEPDFYFNVTALWSKAAAVAFGSDGALDESACVAGSATNKDAQQGRGEGSPVSGASASKSKSAAAPLLRPLQGAWTAGLAWSTLVLGSMAFGASLI